MNDSGLRPEYYAEKGRKMMTERYILQFPRGVAVSIFPYDTPYLNDEKFLEEFKRQIREAFRNIQWEQILTTFCKTKLCSSI